MRYEGKYCVPKVDELRNQILEKAHGSCYSIHLGLTKMHHDSMEVYWWEYLKKIIAKFVDKCRNCQQVKANIKMLVAYYNKSKFLFWSGKTLIWIF